MKKLAKKKAKTETVTFDILRNNLAQEMKSTFVVFEAIDFCICCFANHTKSACFLPF